MKRISQTKTCTRSRRKADAGAPLFAVLAFIAGLMSAGNAFGQTAADLFQTGLRAKTATDKIEAFRKATQIDPNYVEAYYYLGLAYEADKQYARAEAALNKAYFKNPYGLTRAVKAAILLELGAVRNRVDKPEEAIEALRSAREIAPSSTSLRGRIAYELGLAYEATGNSSAALTSMREAERLQPQDKGRFELEIARIEAGQKLQDRYDAGRAALDSGNIEASISALEEVVATDRNYKDAQALLAQARKRAAKSNESGRLADLYRRARQAEGAGSVASASGLYRQLLALDARYRDAATRLQALQASGPPGNVDSRVEANYRKGLAALKKQQWQAAIDAFDAVQQFEPGYRDVERRVEEAENAIQAEEALRKRAAQLYGKAMVLMQKQAWRRAAEPLRELQSVIPGYRDSEEQLLRVRDALAESRATRLAGGETRIDTLYRSGMQAVRAGDWLNAVLAFEKVDLLNPSFRDVQQRLAEARFNLERSGPETPGESRRTSALLWAAAAISLLLLPVAGVYLFSPTVRARLYLIQGNYLKAADVYEKVLSKKPEKVALYPILANIYLLENRRDPRAIQVFEMVLKLNLLTSRTAEINSIVSDHYLTVGRTDRNVIAVMEQELSKKMKYLSGRE